MVSPNERGDTLAEILIAVALFGITGVALLQGLFTLAASAGSGKRLASGQTVLSTAAEMVSGASFQKCTAVPAADPGYPTEPPSPYTRPTGWSGAIATSYEYWNGSTFTTTCPTADQYNNAPYDALLLQRVTITVTTTGKPARTIMIVKRA